MQAFGLRIGEVGLEFETREARSDALVGLSRGTFVNITPKHQAGPSYTERLGEEAALSLYERDVLFQVVRCNVCQGLFPPTVCSERDYPFKRIRSISGNDWEIFHNYICDDCLTERTGEKETDEKED